MAAPTYSHKPSPVNPGPEDNLGGQAVDANRIAIQGIGSGFITTDISASPITSPTTLSTGVTTVTVPVSAISIIITNLDTTNNVLVSELVGMGATFAILPKTSVTLQLTRQGFLYLKSSASTVSCSFVFQLID